MTVAALAAVARAAMPVRMRCDNLAIPAVHDIQTQGREVLIAILAVSSNLVVVVGMQRCEIDKMRNRSDKTSSQTSLLHQALAIGDTRVCK